MDRGRQGKRLKERERTTEAKVIQDKIFGLKF